MADSVSPSDPPAVRGARPLAEVWPEWRERARQSARLALILDFDGTLVRIAPRPEAVSLTEDVRRTLSDLAARPGVSVIVLSGRPQADLATVADLPGVSLLGSHGYEMPLPAELNAVVESARRAFAEGERDLARRVEPFAGAWLEPKPSGATVHFRAVPAERHPEIVAAVEDWHRAEPARAQTLQLRPARAAVEVRPRLAWGKGEASRWWLETAGPPELRGSLVMSAGDDDTDEDLFREWSGQGLSVRVGGDPAATAADGWVETPDELWAWLAEVDELRRDG